jgi:hypothetical protein
LRSKKNLKQLTEDGLESLPEMILLLVNQAMQINRGKHLYSKTDECNDELNGHANGYSPRVINSRVSEVTFDI